MDQPTVTSSRRSLPVDEASLRAGIRQAWGWAIMFGAGEASFGLFAAKIKMPTFFFGLLAGIPLLLGPLIQALSANCLDRYGRRKKLVLGGALAQIVCFAPLALLAFMLARGGEASVSALWVSIAFLILVSVYFAAGSFTHPPYSSMISELVPEQRRGDYFARVSRDASLLVLIAQAFVGVALWMAEKPGASGSTAAIGLFAVAFAVAGVARMHSYAQVASMKDPPYEPKADAYFTFVQFIRRARESNFVKFVLFIALTNFSAQLAGPYFLPYWTYELKYDTSHWVVLSGAATLSSILTLPWWGRFSNRFGNKFTLIVTGVAIGLVPLGWMVSTQLYYLVVVNLLSGVVWAGFNLASWNYILEAVTPHKRARCVAYFNIVCGVGMFSGAMIGGWLRTVLPAYEVRPGLATPFFYLLILSGVFRLLSCVLLLPLFRELRQVHPFPARQWVFRMARIRFPVGVRFDAEPMDDDPAEVEPPAGHAGGTTDRDSATSRQSSSPSSE